MMSPEILISVLVVVGLVALFGWLLSLQENNVNAVDSLWSIFFLFSALVVIATADQINGKNLLIFCLIAIWAIRLSAFLTFRNWGKAEDRRYSAIREKYNPGFRYKSFFIIYLFQAVLATVIFTGLAPGLSMPLEFRWFDLIAVSIALGGIIFEAVADWQLQNFKMKNSDSKAVMNQGLWGLSRHPNYFGEFMFWWGMFFMIVSTAYWWVMISPLIMTFLLLKFSGVSLMEKDIDSRRPEYAQYVRNTPAFFPRLSGFISNNKQAGQTL